MTGPTPYQFAILMGLQRKKPGEIYAGTVSFKTKAKRHGKWPAYKRRKALLWGRYQQALRSAYAHKAAA